MIRLQSLSNLFLLVIGHPGVAVLIKLVGMAARSGGLDSLEVDELAEVLTEEVGGVQIATMRTEVLF